VYNKIEGDFEMITFKNEKEEKALLEEKDIKDYLWSPFASNFCLTKDRKYVLPIQELAVCKLSRKTASIMLQKIYTYRYGYANTRIGVSAETDMAIAKSMNVWGE